MLSPRQIQNDKIIIDKAIAMLRAGGISCDVVDELKRGSDRLWLMNRQSSYRGLGLPKHDPE